jgi:hypothetical protein
MRERGEHRVVVCFVQPPAHTSENLERRRENRTNMNSQVNTEVFEHSKASANKKRLAKYEMAVPDPGGDLERDVLGEQGQQPGQQVHVSLQRA